MMTRKEIYAKINLMGLASEIKEVFGDNYTRISNYELESYITKVEASLKKACAKKAKVSNSALVDPAIVRLVSLLQASALISAHEASFVLNGK